MAKQSDKVYAALKERIVSWDLAPSTPVPESEVSQEFGASRTPVREALQKLAREGLVRIIPGRGAFVAEISFSDIVELSQMREALECQAARLASHSPQRAVLVQFVSALEKSRSTINETDNDAYYELTQQLDATICELAGNERLRDALDEVWAQVERMRHGAATNVSRLCDSVDEHIAIVEAIIDGQPACADDKTRRHLSNSVDNLLHTMRSEPAAQHRSKAG